jgi:hypothetical protein
MPATDKTIRTALVANFCLDAGTYYTCNEPPINAYPFCNTTLDTVTRVNDLVSRMVAFIDR